MINHSNEKTSKKEKKIIELYKFYKKNFELPSASKEETLEDKIERINPYYTRNKTLNYVGE